MFAVGWGGTILHYNGTDWRVMTSGTGETLSAVWGSSNADVFAVGNRGHNPSLRRHKLESHGERTQRLAPRRLGQRCE